MQYLLKLNNAIIIRYTFIAMYRKGTMQALTILQYITLGASILSTKDYVPTSRSNQLNFEIIKKSSLDTMSLIKIPSKEMLQN